MGPTWGRLHSLEVANVSSGLLSQTLKAWNQWNKVNKNETVKIHKNSLTLAILVSIGVKRKQR